MEQKACPYCSSTLKSIKESGFVGCEHCYREIKELEEIVRQLFDGKSFSGRKPARRRNEEF